MLYYRNTNKCFYLSFMWKYNRDNLKCAKTVYTRNTVLIKHKAKVRSTPPVSFQLFTNRSFKTWS